MRAVQVVGYHTKLQLTEVPDPAPKAKAITRSSR